MARVHLIVGPVGAGKSTFARQLCLEHSAVLLNLDDWMAELFSPDRPDSGVIEWYAERSRRCIEQIWKLTTALIAVGNDVVLEIGLIRRHDRERLYRRLDAAALDHLVYVMDAPRDVRRQRVRRRNRAKGATFSMIVPDHIFELASDMWEPPDEAERSGRAVRVIPHTDDGGLTTARG